VLYGSETLNSTINLDSLTVEEGFQIITSTTLFPAQSYMYHSYDHYNYSCAYNTTGDADYPDTLYMNFYYKNVTYNYNAVSAGGDGGDINNDGYDDMIIGSPYAYTSAGEVFILYGAPKREWNSTFYLSSLENPDSTNGYIIYGAGKQQTIYLLFSLTLVSIHFFLLVVFFAGSVLPLLCPYLGQQNDLYYGDQSGTSVAGNFDFNYDGIDDVLVGCPYANNQFGISYIIYGSVSPPDNNELFIETLSYSQGIGIYSSVLSSLGWSVSRAGDYNGDGIDDIILGMPTAGGGAGQSVILYGSSGSLTNIQLNSLTAKQGKLFLGIKNKNSNSGYCETGFSVSGGSDYNRDGLSDVVIGAPFQEAGENGIYYSAGAGYGIFGTSTETAALSLKYLTTVYTYSAPSSITAVRVVGDINKDGYNDFAVGTYSSNNGYLILGSSEGMQSIGNLTKISSDRGYSIHLNYSSGWFGYSISGIGDFNGDGFADYVIGAPGSLSIDNYYPYFSPSFSPKTGFSAVYIIYGNSSISNKYIQKTSMEGVPGVFIEGLAESASGFATAGLGNFRTQDGNLGTLAFGAPFANGSKGAVYVVYGSTDYGSSSTTIHLGASSLPENVTVLVISGARSEFYTGYSVASAGDVNGDGYQDLIFSAPCAGYYAEPLYSSSSVSSHSERSDSESGSTLSDSLSEGKRTRGNRKKLKELQKKPVQKKLDQAVVEKIRSRKRRANVPLVPKESTQLGSRSNRLLREQSEEPTAYLRERKIEGNELEDFERFVNGHGQKESRNVDEQSYYFDDDFFDDDDLFADDDYYNPSQYYDQVGIIYLLLGGSYLQNTNYIDLATNFTNSFEYGITIYGVNPYDQAGISVSGVGDINGDGYADYAIGCPYAGNLYILYGAATLPKEIFLSSLSAGSSSIGILVQGADSDAFTGFSVAGAGDVNNDGFPDVIASAPGANNYAGIVYIIFGGKSLPSSISLSSFDSSQGITITNNVLYNMIGWTVSSFSDKKGNVMSLLGL
jgi:hypothetical protein